MRKLSKKISMLMVLAMLVSLFSGVVSASAASSWSFYNKTTGEIVEVKETIEMESNQFADFDLYKDGKAFDTDVYTVKYESSDADVVWVDAKNGKLRADKFETAEAGDKAVISAKIENKNTGAKTTKSFTITIAEEEVVVEPEEETYTLTATVGGAVLGAEALVADKDYALAATVVNGDGEAVEATIAYTVAGAAVEKLNLKAGEYTVVVTATLDGEVIATEKYDIVVEAEVPEVVSKKQTSLTTVEITLNNADWAKKFAENIKLSYFAGDVEIADLVKATKVEGATVTVTLYNAMTADVNYKFSYEGYDCSATITGAKAEPAYIKVVGGSVPQIGKVDVKIYTAAGVDITTDELKANVSYKSLDPETCDVTGDDIFFYEIGKTAPVEATYEMGWNEAGEELTDLTAKGVYTSVNEYEYSNPNAYAVTTAGKAASWVKDNLSFGSNVTVALDDTVALYAKYTETKYNGDVAAKFICDGTNQEGASFKFYSTNESVVLVNETTGELAPCKVGSASIYIKNSDDKVVGSVVVTVKEARKLNSFTARIDKKKLSTYIAADSTYVAVSAKDQLGADHAVTYSLELVSPLKAGNTDLTIGDFFTNYNALTVVDGKIELQLNKTGALAAIADNAIQTVAFNIKATDADDANNVKSQRLSVSIKDMTGSYIANTTLDVSANSVDTKLDKNEAAYNVTIKLTDVDKDGFAMGDHALGFAAAASATTDAYTVVISKGDTKYTASDAHFSYADDVITIAPVIDGAAVTKMEAGTYKIQLFKGVNGTATPRPIKVEYLTITDSTAAITVDVKADTIATADAAGVQAALDFYRNGVKINDYVTVSAVVDPVSAIDGKYYVKNIKVQVNPTEMKWDSDIAATFEETVSVNQLFKVN